MTTPTAPTPSFQTHFGHFVVSVKDDALHLEHAAGQVLDHLTWDQVQALLLTAIRHVRPGMLADVAALDMAAGDPAAAAAPAATPAAVDPAATAPAAVDPAPVGIPVAFVAPPETTPESGSN